MLNFIYEGTVCKTVASEFGLEKPHPKVRSWVRFSFALISGIQKGK